MKSILKFPLKLFIFGTSALLIMITYFNYNQRMDTADIVQRELSKSYIQHDSDLDKYIEYLENNYPNTRIHYQEIKTGAHIICYVYNTRTEFDLNYERNELE